MTTRVQHIAGYGAALAMVPYFVLKIFWTLDGLRGGGLHGGAWSRLDWAAVNGLTVAMAGTAILLGLALARHWRLPAPVVLFPAWLGAGFLVPMIPLMPLALLLTTGAAAEESSLPALEVAVVSASFAGFGLGVAIAFPRYALRRWPSALSGVVPAATSPVQLCVARLVAVLCAVLGCGQLYWALGGTIGLSTPGLRDAQWHLFTGNGALWTLIAGWGVWTVTHRASGRIATLLAWVASGFLFAWGSWKAAFSFAAEPAELPFVLSLVNHLGALAGLAVLLLVLLRGERAVPGPALQDQAVRDLVG